MSYRSFVLAGLGVPFLACSIIPDLIVAPISGQWGTNLFWGLIFGFGWWAAQSVVGVQHSGDAAAFGMIFWPPIVLAGLFVLSRWVWETGNHRSRKSYVVLLAITCFAIVPAKTAMILYANARVPPDFNYLMAAW